MKQTAVEWIIEQINNVKPHQFCSLETIKEWCEQAKAMEKEQRGYSEEDVIKIVEKSRETGLTAEYLLLTFKSEQDETAKLPPQTPSNQQTEIVF